MTRVITAGWAIALIVLLSIRGSLRPDLRWWIWTCVAGLGLGLFALWYLPRLKRSRGSQGARDAQDSDHSAPRDSGSKTVSSTETPGRSTRS